MAKRDLPSQDGDEFVLPEGEFAVLTRIYERRRLAECLWQGMIGLFSLDDLHIVQNSKAVKDQERNVLVHSTPSPRKSNIGEEIAYRMSQASDLRYSQRSTAGMKVLQPSDLNRITEEEFKGDDQGYDYQNYGDYEDDENYQSENKSYNNSNRSSRPTRDDYIDYGNRISHSKKMYHPY